MTLAAPIALDPARFEPLARALPAGFVEARLSAHWAAGLPALPHGHWHTEGWTGGVLHAADAATVAAFVNAAIAALL